LIARKKIKAINQRKTGMNKDRMDEIEKEALKMVRDPDSEWAGWDKVTPQDALDLISTIRKLKGDVSYFKRCYAHSVEVRRELR